MLLWASRLTNTINKDNSYDNSYNSIFLYTKPWLIPGFLIRLDKFPLLSNRALVLLDSIYVLSDRRPMNSEEQPNPRQDLEDLIDKNAILNASF